MFRTYSMELAGRTLTAEIGRVAEQANGAVLLRYGDTTVLVTATASEKPRDGIDFFPLSIDYEERLYSVGKIPGGFIKREGRPSEKAILTARCIDRPLRPLFRFRPSAESAMWRSSSSTKSGMMIFPSIKPVWSKSMILPSMITLVSRIFGLP